MPPRRRRRAVGPPGAVAVELPTSPGASPSRLADGERSDAADELDRLLRERPPHHDREP